MDLNFLKSKLDSLQSNSKNSTPKIDYKTIYWRPPVGKSQIRILQSAFKKNSAFTELRMHYGIHHKLMISPLSFGEKDPIAIFASKLRENYDKENFLLAKKLDPKTRVFAPVIVRGEEDKGVRLWEFGVEMYKELISLALDEEIGDYTDVLVGRDLTVETVDPKASGKKYNISTVRVRLTSTPLSDDESQVNKWLSEQPNPTEQFKRYSFDEMKSALEKWLAPEEEEGEEEETEEEIKTPVAQSPGSLATSDFTLKQNVSKADEFSALFEDEDSNGDDLSFL
jgi:hypothetical protein